MAKHSRLISSFNSVRSSCTNPITRHISRLLLSGDGAGDVVVPHGGQKLGFSISFRGKITPPSRRLFRVAFVKTKLPELIQTSQSPRAGNEMEIPKRGRGRPKGSKNKPKIEKEEVIEEIVM